MNVGIDTRALWERHRATITRTLERGVVAATLIYGAWFVLQYLFIALNTVDYPYHLEWMEGGVVETVDRLMAGQDIYGPPSLDYVPYIYTPLYFVAGGAFSLVMGVDLFALRLVSLLSFMGCGWLIYRFVQRETGSHRWAFLGVAFLVATFEISGRWFHLARVDSFYLLLILAPFYILRFRTSARSAAVAGVLLWLAFMTKQSALVAAAPGLLYFAFADRRRGLWAAGLFAGLTVISVIVANAISDGWFSYYIFDVPRLHPTVDAAWGGFWKHDLWRASLAGAGALLAVGLFTARKPSRGAFYVLVCGGLIGSAWGARLHSGGYLNVLIPAFAALAILMPLGFWALEQRSRDEERARFGGSPTVIGVALVIIFQFAVLHYPTRTGLPPDGAQDQGDQFLAMIAGMPGEVLLPDHRWIQTWADKRSYGLGMASRDILRIPDREDRGRKLLEAELTAAFQERRFSHVILSEKNHLSGMLRRHYRLLRRTSAAPRPITGWTIKPEWIYVPR